MEYLELKPCCQFVVAIVTTVITFQMPKCLRLKN